MFGQVWRIGLCMLGYDGKSNCRKLSKQPYPTPPLNAMAFRTPQTHTTTTYHLYPAPTTTISTSTGKNECIGMCVCVSLLLTTQAQNLLYRAKSFDALDLLSPFGVRCNTHIFDNGLVRLYGVHIFI